MNKQSFSLTLRQRKAIGGLMFISPFLFGFLFFILYPIYQSILFSFSELSIGRDGMMIEFIGLENYSYVLTAHPTFVRDLTETVMQMVRDVPLILLFGFFSA